MPVTRAPRDSRVRAARLLALLVAAFVVLGPGVAAATAPAAAPASHAAPAARAQQPSPSPTMSPAPAAPATQDGNRAQSPVTVAVLLGAVSLIPALLLMVTAFTRIVIVLGFTRTALNTNGIPPNQVLVGLALFLTMFVMAPILSAVNADAIQPYLKGEIDSSVAYDRGIEPLREFMLDQTRERDLALFVKMSGETKPVERDALPTSTLVPAFVLSELRTAFLIGFVIFIPFLVIDLVVSAALSSMGMVMLPPVMVSLPFKLLLFVAADGWYLVVSSLVQSFR